MNDGHLILDGKRYLSSRKASSSYGYAQDYIGQLIRSKKIDAQLVGRSWFVSEESLKTYLASREGSESKNHPQASTASASRDAAQTPSISDVVYHADTRELLPRLQKRSTPRALRSLFSKITGASVVFDKAVASVVALAIVWGGASMADASRREAVIGTLATIGESMGSAIESTIYDLASSVRLVGSSYLSAIDTVGEGILRAPSTIARIPSYASVAIQSIDENNRRSLAAAGAAMAREGEWGFAERIAVAVYRTMHSIFDGAGDRIARIMGTAEDDFAFTLPDIPKEPSFVEPIDFLPPTQPVPPLPSSMPEAQESIPAVAYTPAVSSVPSSSRGSAEIAALRADLDRLIAAVAAAQATADTSVRNVRNSVDRSRSFLLEDVEFGEDISVIGGATVSGNMSVQGSFSAGNLSGIVFATDGVFGTTSAAAIVGDAFMKDGNSFGTTTVLGTNDANALQFETNGATRLTVTSTGYVGIGTTTPSRALDVVGVAGFHSATTPGSFFRLGADEIGAYFEGDTSGRPISFYVGGTERVRYTTTGVGIGTTSPSSALSVASSSNQFSLGNGTTQLRIGSNGNTIYDMNFDQPSSTNDAIIRMFRNTNTSGTVSLDILRGNNTSGTAIRLSGNGNGWINPNGGSFLFGFGTLSPSATVHIASSTPTSDLFKVVGGANTVVIAASGNVGIGTTTPIAKLSVYDTLGSTAPLFDVGSTTSAVGTSSIFRINANGNVGIGTTNLFDTVSIASPYQALSTGRGQLGVFTTDDMAIDKGGLIVLGGSDTTGGVPVRTFAGIGGRKENATSGNRAGYLQLMTRVSGGDLVERVRITSTGNVGIGTTTPNNLLHLNPTSVGSGLTINESDDASRNALTALAYASGIEITGRNNGSPTAGTAFRFDSTSNAPSYFMGSLGVGTSTPGARLTIESSDTQLSLANTAGATSTLFTDSSGRLNVFTGNNMMRYSAFSSGAYMQSEVSGGGARFFLNRNGATSDLGLYFANSGTNLWTWGLLGTDSTSDLSLFNGGLSGTKALTILKSNSNVGIGTTNPTRKLELYASSAGTTTGLLKLKNEGGSVDTAAAIDFDFFGSDSIGARIAGVRTNAGNFQGALAFFTNSGSSGSSITERMRIAGDGNVGIGTTTPTNLLSLGNSDATSLNAGTYQMRVNGANDRRLAIGVSPVAAEIQSAGSVPLYINPSGTNNTILNLSGGNVGVGTTSPAAKLSIASSGTDGARISSGNPYVALDYNVNGIQYGRFYANSADNSINLDSTYTGNTGAINLQISGSTRATLASSGNFGIGTTTPLAKLSVYNTLGSTVPLFDVGSTTSAVASSSLFRVNANGKIGIGTTSPSAKLSLKGDGTGSGMNLVTTNSSDTINFMVLDNGNVGIGTSSLPTAELDVAGQIRALPITSYGSVGGGPGAVLRYNRVSGNDYGEIVTYDWNISSYKPLRVQASSISIMPQSSSAGLGVGTTNPSMKLHVAGSSGLPTVGGNVGSIRVQGVTNSVLDFGNTDASPFGNWIQSRDIAGSQTYPLLLQPMGGNVGIGTTSPNARLTVKSSAANTDLINGYRQCCSERQLFGLRESQAGVGELALYDGNGVQKTLLGGADSYFNGGSVAIGTTTSTASLNVYRATTGIAAVIRNADGNAGRSGLLVQATDSGSSGSDDYILRLQNNSGTITWFTVDKGGNLGIGTTTPIAKLSVYDTLGSTAPLFDVGSTTSAVGTSSIFRINANGNVGIGTASPTNSLTIPSTGTGVAIYNTSDQTTNYERFLAQWSSNQFMLGNDAGGTGIQRGVALFSGGSVSTGNRTELVVNRTQGSSGGRVQILGNRQADSTAGFVTFSITPAVSGQTNTSGSSVAMQILPTYNQTSGTAANTDFLINRTETAVGSGAQRLFDAQVGGVSRFVIINTGNVGIGTTTPSAQFTTTGTVRLANFGSGTLQTDALGNVSVSSDERLKDVYGSFARGLASIRDIQPIVYRWNATSGLDMSDMYAGFSAQNVEASIPEAVGVSPNGFLTLSDRPILAATVNAIKELDLSVASTTARITAAEARIGSIEAILASGSWQQGTSTSDASIATSTVTSMVSGWLSSLGATIENAFARFVAIVADFVETKRLTVGDTANLAAAGITVFDRATGEPVCMYIENGAVKSESGACGNAAAPSSGADSGQGGGEAPVDGESEAPSVPFTVSIAPDAATSEGGGTVAFTVVLDEAPTGDVELAVSVDDATEATVNKTLLIFRADGPTAWDVPQTVTITGVDDEAVDGSQTFTLTVGGQTFSVINHDNEDTPAEPAPVEPAPAPEPEPTPEPVSEPAPEPAPESAPVPAPEPTQ